MDLTVKPKINTMNNQELKELALEKAVQIISYKKIEGHEIKEVTIELCKEIYNWLIEPTPVTGPIKDPRE